MTEVRFATQEDVPTLLELARAMHAESRYQAIAFDYDRAAQVARHLISNGCALLAFTSAGPAGMLLARLEPLVFSHSLVASDVALYVSPGLRGTWAGIRLVECYIAWAEQAGALEISVGVSAGIDDEQVGRFYERLGFRLVGTARTYRRM